MPVMCTLALLCLSLQKFFSNFEKGWGGAMGCLEPVLLLSAAVLLVSLLVGFMAVIL